MELRENSGDQGKRGSDPRHQRLVLVNMVKLTMLARVADGLPLAEGLDSDRQQDLEQYKQQAKTLFKKLSQGPPPPSRMSYESGAFFLHYLIEGGVCYLTLCDRGYPKKLAYQYLEDLCKEFGAQNGGQVETGIRNPAVWLPASDALQFRLQSAGTGNDPGFLREWPGTRGFWYAAPGCPRAN